MAFVTLASQCQLSSVLSQTLEAQVSKHVANLLCQAQHPAVNVAMCSPFFTCSTVSNWSALKRPSYAVSRGAGDLLHAKTAAACRHWLSGFVTLAGRRPTMHAVACIWPASGHSPTVLHAGRSCSPMV